MLICILPVAKDVKHLKMYFLVISISSFGKFLFSSTFHFNWVIYFLAVNFLRCLFISDINSLCILNL